MWYCLYNKGRLAAWAEKLAKKTDDANTTTAGIFNTTNPSAVPPVPSPKTKKAQTATALANDQAAGSARSCVLLQRRTRPVNATDMEERGEANAA